MKNFLQWFEAGCGFVGLALVALFCYYAFPHKADRDIWDVITAIGTVGAVAVALWIATSQARRIKEEDVIKAKLIASSLQLQIFVVQIAIREVCELLALFHEADAGAGPLNKCIGIFDRLNIWTIEELVPLVHLENRIAIRLSDARHQIMHARETLRMEVDAMPLQPGGKRRVTMIKLKGLLLGTCEALDGMPSECRILGASLHAVAD